MTSTKAQKQAAKAFVLEWSGNGYEKNLIVFLVIFANRKLFNKWH